MGTPMTPVGHLLWSDISQVFSAPRENIEALYMDLFRKRIKETTENNLVIMDYGTGDGGIVLPLFQKLLGFVRKQRFDREVTFVFNDLPGNDYNALARKITACTEFLTDSNAHVLMNIGNVYERCMPKESVDCGYCFYVVMWLSSKCKIHDGLFWTHCSKEERKIMHNQSALDWKKFLFNRAEELKPGGCMIIDLPGDLGFPYDICQDTFQELLQERVISKEEYTDTVVALYQLRGIAELRQPFDEFGEELDLELLDITVRQSILDKEKLDRIGGMARVMQGFMFVSIMEGLSDMRTEEDKKQTCELFFQRLDGKIKSLEKEKYIGDIYVVSVKKRL